VIELGKTSMQKPDMDEDGLARIRLDGLGDQLGDRLGDRLLVIFDGRCGFCNGTIRWLLRRDRHDRLRFSPSQSTPLDGDLEPGSVVVVRGAGRPGEQVLVRSDAFIAILRELPAPWPWFARALGLFPAALRNLGYRLVARNRYRLGGHLDVCPLPSPDEQRHFL
jgi:predicted DCC family thiol-disulfide oxidoreductase YuxK